MEHSQILGALAISFWRWGEKTGAFGQTSNYGAERTIVTRILRYLGNREAPEADLYGHVDKPIARRSMVEPITYDVNDPKIPHLIETGMKKDGDLYVPKYFERELATFSALMMQYNNRLFYSSYPLANWGWDGTPKPAKPKEESPFEVNMMEALVGWKALSVEDGVLRSASMGMINWPVDAPLVAKCNTCKRTEPPYEHCSCGIYASDEREGAESYNDDHEDILALVYGWGKYVRGDDGWRAQYAYPKCFYLEHGQAPFIEVLKVYHVPIYIEQPTLIYNPEEDGYEHRGEEADWNLRAIEESAAAEARDSSDEED